ncbi:MAG: ribosome silencing factor [Proteobacteria bacterium]|nr:ribosome silencing factor [Pseudomonadota bacterium]
MDIRKLQRAIVDGLEDVKAQNIAVFNTEHLSPLFERVIIASGTSNRQTRSLANSVREAVKEAGYGVPRMEGEANGEWIIVDCGPAVVHVMQPSIRDYYHLEEIWGGKPVRVKLGAERAADGVAGAVRPAVAKKAAKKAPSKAVGKAAPAKPAAAKKAAAKKTAQGVAARKRAPAKTPARRSTNVVTRVIGVKSTSARRAPAKTAARKSAGGAKRTSRG